MNKVIMMGRLTRDPEVRYSQSRNGDQMAIARFSIAVDRKFSRNSQDGNDTSADFFNCTAFGRLGEFVEKYLKQGTKVALTGRVQNDNYTNKNGEKVYSVQIIAEEIEFAESKAASQGGGYQGGGYQPAAGGEPAPRNASADDFMSIPEGIENDLPFK
ncbi:MAG: single-stranded DNA-binding protein [Eubacterium sp.]|nr:single-stranded DNA-binding protein [Eubacterium sp.]MBR6172360.1 single-stranded DNA-binding protein [Eubacterium sp.]